MVLASEKSPGARSVLALAVRGVPVGTQAWEKCSMSWRMRNVVLRELAAEGYGRPDLGLIALLTGRTAAQTGENCTKGKRKNLARGKGLESSWE